jgi:DNA-binding MarR family transcriptional regulator
MATAARTSDSPALRLAVAVKRLKARMREAAPAGETGLPISQLAILHRLRSAGPATAATLAAAEHVSQQAIAQSLAALKRAGLVRAARDRADRRKQLISVTRAGHALFDSALALRTAWLAAAIDATIPNRERPALERAVELLERLADAHPVTAPAATRATPGRPPSTRSAPHGRRHANS